MTGTGTAVVAVTRVAPDAPQTWTVWTRATVVRTDASRSGTRSKIITTKTDQEGSTTATDGEETVTIATTTMADRV